MSFPPPSDRQARVIWFALTTLAVTLTVAIIGMLFWGMGQILVVLSPVLWPLAVAGIIAFLLDPVVEWLDHHRVPRLRAILLVFGAAALLVLGVFGSLVPRAVAEARDLATRITHDYVPRARKRIDTWIEHPPAPLVSLLPEALRKRLAGWKTNSPPGQLVTTLGPAAVPATNGPALASADRFPAAGPQTHTATNLPIFELPPAPADAPLWWKALDPRSLRTAGDWLATVLPEVGRWMVGQLGRVASWFGVLAGLALIPIYAFYFLLEKSSIERRWTDYLPVADSRFKDELVWLLKNINDALIVFFRGQVLVAMCDGVLYTIGFLAIGLPYALLLGLVATLLTIVPFLGAIVTCGTALLIALVQFGDLQHPLMVLAVFAVVQTLEGWVIQPRIIGDRVGLHPVSIIIALLVGTTLMGGILGGLLAIPATAVLRALMFRYVWHSR